MNVSVAAKAVIGFVTPGVVGLVAAVNDISPGGSAVTFPEWVGIGASMILTGGAVYVTPNKDTAEDGVFPESDDDQPIEGKDGPDNTERLSDDELKDGPTEEEADAVTLDTTEQ